MPWPRPQQPTSLRQRGGRCIAPTAASGGTGSTRTESMGERSSIMPPSVPPDALDYAAHAEDLQVLSCRRTTLEWVLRRCTLAASNV
jgi:hypothetical protein